jgi:ABC-type anion transport system duplicated permease subunit
MSILLTILLGVFSAIPFVIAMKRKHANMILLAVLDLLFSWTIIGWFAVLAWAIWGKTDPKEYAKQSGLM